MTRIILLTREDSVRGFICAGHSGYSAAGSDIVCAAISTLTQGCVNAVERVAGVAMRVKIGEGFLAALLPDDCQNHDAEVLLKGLYQGLCDIKAQYPTYIRLSMRAESEWRKHSC